MWDEVFHLQNRVACEELYAGERASPLQRGVDEHLKLQCCPNSGTVDALRKIFATLKLYSKSL